MPDLSRRAVLSGAATSLAAASLAACGEVQVVPGAEPPPAVEGFGGGGFDARFAGLYGPVAGERLPDPGTRARDDHDHSVELATSTHDGGV